MLVPLFIAQIQEPPVLRVISAKPAPEIDALFQRNEGWIGADGFYSVVTPGRILWLFSDTFVGKIRNGHRVDSTMVNNTVGVQRTAKAPVEFSISKDANDKAKAQITPSDGHGWFWQQSGIYANGNLYRFLNQVERAGEGGAFGFRSVGLWLGVTPNPTDDPTVWKTNQVKLENSIFDENRTMVWGAASIQNDGKIYVFGTDDRRLNGRIDRAMTLARAPKKSIADTSAWQYFDGEKWSKDFRKAAHLASGLATEYSITRFERGYLAVYTENGFSPKIFFRFATKPWGPWSAPSTIYTCPEMGSIPKAFTYAAKAHASLSSQDEITLSYAVNSFDFSAVINDASLYWPRFVKVKLALHP